MSTNINKQLHAIFRYEDLVRYSRPRQTLYLRVFALRLSAAFIRANCSGEAFLRSSRVARASRLAPMGRANCEAA